MKSKVANVITSIIILTLMLAGFPNVAQAAPGADFSIQPSTQTVGTNQIFTVDIKVDASTQEVDTVQAYVDFDTTYLKVVDADGNIIDGTANDIIIPGEITNTNLTTKLSNKVDNDNGYADIAYGMPPGGNPANEAFVLGTIRFKAMAETTGTTLTFHTAAGLRQTMAIMLFTPVTGTITDATVTISAPDVPPTVVATVPDTDATDIAVDTTIQVTFSEAMNTASAESAFSVVPAVSGSFSWDTTTMTFDPAADLDYNTLYTITISTGALDLADNGLDGNNNGTSEGSPTDDYVWSFTTENMPLAVTTMAATDFTQTSATLRGNLDSLGDDASIDVSFVWDTESQDNPADYPNGTTPVTVDSPGAFTFLLSGLDAETTYYYRAKATGSVTVYGDERHFTTLSDTDFEIAYDDGSGEDIGYLYKAEAQQAVLFTPPSYPVNLNTARIHLGLTNQPDGDHEPFEMRVYDNDGPEGAPGTLLGSVPTMATTWGWWDVDISGLGITINSGSFYVAYFQLTAQPDCEATSADKTQPYAGRSWRKYGPTNLWEEDSYVNRMIRCVVGLILPPSVSTEEATNITTGSADLNLSYDFKDYGSGEVRFGYKQSSDTTWTYTSWVAKASSGSYFEAITGLSSNTLYDFKAQLKYGTAEIEGTVEQFTTLKISPTITTDAATNIITDSADLNLSYDFKDYGSGEVRFGYKQSSDSTWTYTDWEAKSSAGSYTETVTSLSSNTLYDFKAQLKYDSTEIEGAVQQFIAGKVSPTVTTDPATNITIDSADLNMSYDFEDYDSGEVRFGYKQAADSTWTYTDWEAKSSAGSYTETVTSLSSNTLYDFKAQLEYDETVIEGTVEQFTTEKIPPMVTTNAADNITSDSATLHGNLTSLGDYNPVNVSFEWGTTSGDLDHEATPETMTTTGAFTAELSGLMVSNTIYYFRAKATGSVTVYGDELYFTTAKVPPAVTTNAADNITTDSATLHGSLDSLGDYSSANVSFEWGTASGVYSDNTTPEVMTEPGAFSASLSSLAASTTYYFRTKATGSVTVYGDELSFTTLKELVSIEITPDNPSIALGRTQQFTATGTYSDNSSGDITGTVTWTNDNTNVATIGENTGLAQSVAEGQTTISATLGEISDDTILTVSPKVLDAIEITPDNPEIALGRTQQFTATGTYSDSSTEDITGTVTWSSDNTNVATIGENTGLAQSVAEGQTTISATLGEISDNTILTVSPKVLDAIAVTPPNPPPIAAGRTKQFTATGTYSDNSTPDITDNVTWSSSNTTVAIINAAGLATSYAEGTTVITATSGNVTGNTTLTVEPAVLDVVIVTPINPSINFVAGNPPTLQFIATASYSDGATTIVTSTANWTSDNTSIATIGENTGLATTVASGSTNIIAKYSGKTGSTTLTVLPDTVAPVVTLTSPTEGQVLSDNTTTVSGTVDDLAAIANVIVNGGSPVNLPLGVGGNFSQGITLNAGSNTILVTAVDGSGNTGTSGTITVVVNPDKPGIVITQPAAGIVTGNPSLAVTGTVTGNVTSANLILNGESQTISVNMTSGSFSANVTLEDGINILVVNAYTGGHEGNGDYLGTSGVRTVILDTTAPVVIIDSPVSESVVSSPGCVVSGTIDDPGVSTANLTLNDASQLIPVVGGTFSQNITLVPGNNTVTVRATDAVGNISIGDSVTVLFDNTKPEIVITSPVNKTATKSSAITVIGTVDDPTITTATLLLNSEPQSISISSGIFSENITLSTGLNTIEVSRASDNSTSGVINVTLDNTAPVITIGLSDPTESITITVTSDEPLVEKPTVSVNSTVTMTQVDVNKWSGTYGSAGSPLVDGAYTVTANGTDKAGNTRISIATFSKQTVTISENTTETVQTGATTLIIDTTANVTDASITLTSTMQNPSGNVGNPEGAELEAGVFIEIVASPELRDNLEQIYIRVDYDPGELSPETDESTLKLYLWDVTSGTWQVVPNSGVNTTEHYIYGTVTHLSKYGGFGTVPPPPPPPTPGLGGISITTVTLSGFTSVTPLRVDSRGIVQADCQLRSLDEKVWLDIAKMTKLIDAQGKALYSISAEVVTSPPAPPAEMAIISAYNLGPDGAQFEPTITLTMSYDPEALPERAAEDELYIAYWDGSQWLALESTVDSETNTVSTEISYFAQFALTSKLPPPVPVVPPKPAAFSLSNLTVQPAEVELGEQATISVMVTNTGGRRGTYSVILKVNDVEEDRQEVTIDAGKSKTVTFTLAKDKEGTYTININGETGQFTIIAPPPPPSEPEAPTTPEPVEELPVVQPPTTNWGLIGGIIAAVIVIGGLLAYLFWWRRRTA